MLRNTAREIAMHLSYELSFTDLTAEDLLQARLSDGHFTALAPEYEVYGELPGPAQRDYIHRAVRGVADHSYELDRYIEKYAKGWRFERMPLVATAIMRLAMYEILYMPDIPHGASINEAVELTKKYESAEVVRFVNGILGSFVRQEADVSPSAPAEDAQQVPADQTER